MASSSRKSSRKRSEVEAVETSSAGPDAPANGKAGKPSRGEKVVADLDQDRLLAFYRSMYLIRVFEEKVIELFQEGELPGFLHVAIGQEAIATGVSEALDPGDYIGSTHRAHGHVLARGSSPVAMMAELMGRITGYCQGKGGSMHLADMTHNVVGANGVVGAGAPMMTGVALAQQRTDTGKIAVTYYGDGASNQGNVFEAMNLAQLWKLPVLFICENNGYAESTPYWQQVPVKDLAVRGKAFDMKTISVDGNDVVAVYEATLEAAEHARSGKGPVYMVCETKRIVGHYVGDAEVYRPKGEAKEWRTGDPIKRFEALVQEKHEVTADQLEQVRTEVEAEVERAVEEARAAELPPPEAALEHVYAEYPYPGPVLGV
jgi:acetoin:2,6-dichlorophenolindophenol oxidoreductase subunit alpha